MCLLRPEKLTNEEMLAQAKDVFEATCAILAALQKHRQLTDGSLVYGLVWAVYSILEPYHPPTDIAELIAQISNAQKEMKLN